MFRSVSDVGLGMLREVPRCAPCCVFGCEGAGFSLMFWAVAGQVRAVRQFVRLVLAGHPAVADAVAVASELAVNSVEHSGSGLAGGMFTVHVMAIGQAAAWLAVTELRGGGCPQVREPEPDADCGRGLQVVEALTSLFWWSDDGLTRTLFATVPAPDPGVRHERHWIS